ncbi:MAG: DNA methyltransferase, partial [Nostoc sp.]
RSTLRNVVTQCRRLLEESVTELLEGQFGIYITGKVEPVDRMKHLSADDLEYREQLLIHLQHIQAAGSKMNDAVEQLVREVAFTHLNRFCAYKMMETRGLIRKAVSDGLKSQGFLFYLADNSAEERLYTEGKQDVAYRHFLEWLGSTLSEEIGVLFSPHDPANRLLPPQRIIDSILNFINSEELKDIWVEDETIGWVYQYFTPKELRDKARNESQAPRNSYELAFRNQFYTPSYVVQFLTDNTLGRIWYEMQQGETALTEYCKYLVRRLHEVFLAPGEEVPVQDEQVDDLSQAELLKQPVYILHRPKKDPREIKIIDPACGSGHFLLYCFSLLLIIYEEAYNDPDLGLALQRDYPDRKEYRNAVPGLILAHNLHGIDIDIRATQIAALALWLRAQRAYQDMEIKKNRPKITK